MLYELAIQRQIFAKYFCELTAYPLKIIYLTVTLSECSQEGFFFFSKEKKKSLFSYHFRWKERKLQIFIAAKLLTVKPVLKQWIKFPQDHSGAVPFT